jgi:hypothetical protein
MPRELYVCRLDRLHRLHKHPALVIVTVMLASTALSRTVWADEGGNSAICRQQCNYDNESSCYSFCMSERRLYDTPSSESGGSMPAVPTLYGAIAVETDTLIYGYVKDVSSRAEAEQAALAYCRKAGGSASGCEIAVWGHNTCLALATSAGGRGGNTWGYAWSDEGAISRRNAVDACIEQGGTDCKVSVSFCTG